MRLNKIKLAGFKSFVDPTAVNFPSNLIGVVGPNGCGKSNIIDAVRWVMGEISAKHLRGDSMADVVFNGSSSRKPVGTASVELVFDNSDGQLAGQYAGYSEVSLKRVVSRDGQSAYFLNGARCRRKDITQLFLGTGLGSRSYAIIEQGMISRVIEARPEELRGFIEEAAGISKYKERRRETENRIAHTKENLERLSDVREEVEKQLRHLQRQAATARRYQTLKQDERKLTAELLALRLRVIEQDSQIERRHPARARHGDAGVDRGAALDRSVDRIGARGLHREVRSAERRAGPLLPDRRRDLAHRAVHPARPRTAPAAAPGPGAGRAGRRRGEPAPGARPVADRRAARPSWSSWSRADRGARARARIGSGAGAGGRVDAGLAGALGRIQSRLARRQRKDAGRARAHRAAGASTACAWPRSASACRASCRS